ncbi:MAG: hypothetical protein JSS32_06710 [Verrucomicrobia bacterium]|nr:hypothetical protein [Verrucomicrobiota bacterium]
MSSSEGVNRLVHSQPNPEPAKARETATQNLRPGEVVDTMLPTVRYWTQLAKEGDFSLKNRTVTLHSGHKPSTTEEDTIDATRKILGKRPSGALAEQSRVHVHPDKHHKNKK